MPNSSGGISALAVKAVVNKTVVRKALVKKTLVNKLTIDRPLNRVKRLKKAFIAFLE
jgi:hypothetical protein